MQQCNMHYFQQFYCRWQTLFFWCSIFVGSYLQFQLEICSDGQHTDSSKPSCTVSSSVPPVPETRTSNRLRLKRRIPFEEYYWMWCNIATSKMDDYNGTMLFETFYPTGRYCFIWCHEARCGFCRAMLCKCGLRRHAVSVHPSVLHVRAFCQNE